MKAISLHQPWATAVALGLKQYETRSWSTKHRGPIAIHATKKRSLDQAVLFDGWLRENFKIHMAFEDALDLDFDCLHFGAIIAVADLRYAVASDRVQPNSTERLLGDFSPGRYAWRLDNVRRLTCSIVCRGYQQLWTVPPEIEKELSDICKPGSQM